MRKTGDSCSEVAADSRYRATLASIAEAVISTDAQNRIDFMNRTAERLTGWSETEARDGKQCAIAGSGSPIRDESGATIGVVLVFRDNATEMATHKALQQSEARLTFALRTINAGAWDLDLRNHTANRTLTHDRIFGYASLLPAWTFEMFLEHVLTEDRPGVDRRFREATAAEADWNFECRIRRVDGEVRWIWAAGCHERNAVGDPVRLAGVVQDITERKRAEQEIESLARFPLENPSPVLRVRHDGNIIYANPSSKDLLVAWGCKVGDPLPLDLQNVITQSLASNETNRVIVSYNNRVLAVLFVPIPGTDYINLYGRDITEHERAEAQLRVSEAKYRNLHETMRDAFVEVGQDGKMIDFNREYLNMLGYTADELLQLTYQELTPEKWHAMEAELVEQQILKRGHSDVYEKEYRRKDGTIFPVELRAFLLRDPSGQPGNIWGIARDITSCLRLLLTLTHCKLKAYRFTLPSIHCADGRNAMTPRHSKHSPLCDVVERKKTRSGNYPNRRFAREWCSPRT